MVCRTLTPVYQGGSPAADTPDVAVAVATPRTNIKTLRLAQPAVRATSRIEVTAVSGLVLAASGLWFFILPLELLRLVTA